MRVRILSLKMMPKYLMQAKKNAEFMKKSALNDGKIRFWRLVL